MIERYLRYVVALFLMSWLTQLQAHYLDIAHFSLFEKEATGQFELQATLPITLDPRSAVMLPDGCSTLNREHRYIGDAYRVEILIECESASGDIQTRWGRDGAIKRLYSLDGNSVTTMVQGGALGSAVSVPDWSAAGAGSSDGFLATAGRFLNLGTVHVLEGWDHLSFVFCLALLASGLPLLWLITAFTLGHSVSLALAHFGLISIPIVPVEAIIALSVVFMAREALFSHNAAQENATAGVTASAGHTHSLGWRVWLTVLFGLVHGLGFASVLGSLGVTASETVTALAFFNIGVEVGQIMFVLVVLLLIWLVRRIRVERHAVQLAAWAVGGMGVYWTVERVLFGV